MSLIEETKSRSDGTIVLKYRQVILLVLVQLATFAYGYGRLQQDVENMKIQMSELQARVEDARIVSRDEFTDFREEMRNAVRDLHTAILAVK
jgi:hypothetical protein